jgi:hypothetical protein
MVKNPPIKYFFAYLPILFISPTIQQYDYLTVIIYFLAIFSFFYYGRSIDRFFYILLGAILTLLVLQAYKFGNFSVRSFIGIVFLWLVPYFVLKALGLKIIDYFIKILYFLAVISLILWSLCNISEPIHLFLFKIVDFLGTDPESGECLIIYNLEHHRPNDILFMRNAGPFAEGGIFSCYLIVALVINTIYVKKLLEKKNIVFIFSIITTMSTAGYVALFLFISLFYLLKRNIMTRLVLFPISLFIGWIAFSKLPFMEEKIQSQYESQNKMSLNRNVRVGRFHSALVSLKIIKKNPIIGKGLYRKDRFLSRREEEIGITGTSNGVVDFALKYGLVIWVVYFYLFYIALKRLCLLNSFNLEFAFLGIIPIVVTGLAQTPFASPFFAILVYYGYYSYYLGNYNMNVKDGNIQ